MKRLIVTVAIAVMVLAAARLAWITSNSHASDRLPDFELSTLDGRTWRSAEHQEQVLIINFWATWCPPCRKEMPLFVDMQQAFGQNNVQFIGIALDNKEAVAAFAENYGINFPLLLGGMEGSELAKQLGNEMVGLPFTVIVARGGAIHTRHMGTLEEDQLRPVLEQLTRD